MQLDNVIDIMFFFILFFFILSVISGKQIMGQALKIGVQQDPNKSVRLIWKLNKNGIFLSHFFFNFKKARLAMLVQSQPLIEIQWEISQKYTH